MDAMLAMMPSTAMNVRNPPTPSFLAFFFLKMAWLVKPEGAPWLPSFVDVVSSLTWSAFGAKVGGCKAENEHRQIYTSAFDHITQAVRTRIGAGLHAISR